MTPFQVRNERAKLMATARDSGLSFAEIAQVFNLKTKAGRPWKERARAMAAKGARLMRENQRRCTCPAAVDITFTGHLPTCPLGGGK